MDEDADEAEARLWDRLIAALRRSFYWQLAIKLVLVLGGGAMAGVAQLPVPWADATKTNVGLIGVALALTGGALLLIVDNDNVSLLEQVRETLRRWRAVIRERDRLEEERRRLDREVAKSIELTVTFDGMIQLLEQALALPGVDADQRLNRFLGPAAPGLIAVMELGGQYEWTLSVFIKRDVAGEPRMVRVASNWADRERERADIRAWRRGKGWTGEAWRKAEDNPADPGVVEHDAATPQARARYDTDGQEDPRDLTRYRSVAAVPFRDTRTREVIGVVTATSSRPDAFHIDPGMPGRRNLDTIKSFALLVAALIAGSHTAP